MNLDLNQNTLNLIAKNSKIKTETLSETFLLYKRSLLFSDNYDSILIPIFNDTSIVSVIENIILLSYLKEKYNTKIIIVLDKRSKYKNIYNYFENIFDLIFECKRLVELENITISNNCTKLIYNRSYDLDEIKNDIEKTFKNPIKIKNDYEYIYFDKVNYLISSKDYNKTLFILKKLKENVIAKVVNQAEELEYQICDLINSDKFINISSNSIIDYLAPFTKTYIMYMNTSLYDLDIFKYSYAIINRNLKEIKIK